MNTLTADLADRHTIGKLPIVLVDGPDDGERVEATVIYLLRGRRVVRSRHSQGFYWLPRDGKREPDSGRLLARWEPHPDARFSWTRKL